MTRVVIIGVTGRMGRALVRAVCTASMPGRDALRITGAIASPNSSSLGQDAGELAGGDKLGLQVSADLPAALAQADVAIDFSESGATGANLAACRAARKPLLVGTTGFSNDVAMAFAEAARDIPLLVAPNTSVAVTLLIELVRTAAKALPLDFDVEILEAHHRLKVDAPSGTALALGRAANEARGRPDALVVKDALASRVGQRGRGDIGFAVVRAGDLVGEHTVMFAGEGEQLSLTHRATYRAIFAKGALQAGLWLAGQPPGRYAMRDFLGLKTGA
jgi:4-hydroxy-tetrahydrodipicolinate reductase